MLLTNIFSMQIVLLAAGMLPIFALVVLAVGVVTALVGGILGAIHNAKHGHPNSFMERLSQGIEQMRQDRGDATAEQVDAQPDDIDTAAVEQAEQEDTVVEQAEQLPVRDQEDLQLQDDTVEQPATDAEQPATEVMADADTDQTVEYTATEVAPEGQEEAEQEVVSTAEESTSDRPSEQPVAVDYTPSEAMRAATAGLDFEEAAAREVADVDLPYDNTVDELLSRMNTGNMDDLDDFDFDGDFGDFYAEADDTEVIAQLTQQARDEGQEEEPEEEAETEVEEEELDGDWDVELTPAQGPMVQSMYRRTFRAKLIQSSAEVKGYYSALYNELMGYDKMRVGADLNAFALGRRTYVRMAIAGKTLCVYLALDPKAFDPSIFHHRDKSGVRKFAQTPMMMRVRSNLSLRRTLSLILYMAGRNTRFQKRLDYQDVDLSQALAYRTDDELLAMGLIKSNVTAQEVDQTITPADTAAHEAYMATVRQYVDLRPIRPSQVGNLTVGDVENMRAKITQDAMRRNPNASTTGKFVVDVQNDQYRYVLYAPSGDMLYTSKMYATSQAVDRAVDTFREMVKKNTPYLLYVNEGKYYCSVRYGNQVYKFPEYPTKILALQNQQMVTITVKTAVLES